MRFWMPSVVGITNLDLHKAIPEMVKYFKGRKFRKPRKFLPAKVSSFKVTQMLMVQSLCAVQHDTPQQKFWTMPNWCQRNIT